jgi:BolA protein
VTRVASIRALLGALEPVSLEILDESHKHAGHAGARDGGGHYVLKIVSNQFSGKSTVTRHRMIYSLLEPMVKKDIHALTIQAKSPDEV